MDINSIILETKTSNQSLKNVNYSRTKLALKDDDYSFLISLKELSLNKKIHKNKKKKVSWKKPDFVEIVNIASFKKYYEDGYSYNKERFKVCGCIFI